MGTTIRPGAQIRSWLNHSGTLIRELRERQVTRVAITYGAVGWIVLEVCSALLPALGIPEWSLSLVAILIVVGFPLAMVLAWAVEATPEGLRWADSLPDSTPPPGSPLPSGALGARGDPVDDRTPQFPPALSPRTLAALPFADRSPEGGFQFLGDGIAEELISTLARMQGVQVVGRTSAFGFRGDGVDVQELGRRLGVEVIVEGSVRVDGSRLRVTAQVVDVGSGYALAAVARDGTLENVLVLQEEIAHAIVRALFTDLDWEVALPGARARDPEAYQLYLRGRFHWNERTGTSFQAALRYFRRAVQKDPAYAPAHAGEADALALLMEYGLLSPVRGMAQAREAAQEARRWGPELAESHFSTALVHQLEWSWDAAEHAFRKALSLDPGLASAHQRLALLMAWRGAHSEARVVLDEARRLDPLAPPIAATEGWLHYYADDSPQAVEVHARVLADHPEMGSVRVGLGLALLAVDRPSEALEVLEEGAHPRTGEPDPAHLAVLAAALARVGRGSDARERLTELAERGVRGFVSRYHISLPRLALDGPSGALDELARAVTERAPQLAYLAVDPFFRSLRDNPRFQDLIRATGRKPVSPSRSSPDAPS